MGVDLRKIKMHLGYINSVYIPKISMKISSKSIDKICKNLRSIGLEIDEIQYESSIDKYEKNLKKMVMRG